jgi:spermidine synthase
MRNSLQFKVSTGVCIDMSEMVADQTGSVSTRQQYLPLLVLLFIGSGCAALIYEVVWFQILELVIGSSSISLGILLGTFMGGMCLGSLFAPRIVSRMHHPLRVYAYLELGIGALGLIILFAVPLIGTLYTAWAGSGMASMLLRGILAGICLLPPTFLMGATLPAISRWVETTPEGVSWLGFFYGGNIAGAVAGSLLAGFYLLRVYDAVYATLAAVGLNVLVAVVGLIVAKATPYESHKVAESAGSLAGTKEEGSELWPVYVTIALSGFAALSAEVIWTRLLSLLFGATVYTFSLVLAAFLFGLGIGSSAGAAIARNTRRPRVALGWCQMLLCAAVAWAAYQTMESMPWWPVDVTLGSYGFLEKFQMDMVRCLWALLPASILWGASFPLALASLASLGRDAGRVVGGVYAANTVGAIFGALLASLTFVSSFGMQHTQQGLIGVSAISGLLMLALAPAGEESGKATLKFVFTVIFAMALSGLLVAFAVPELNKDFVAYGRFSPVRAGRSTVEYVGEGRMGLVAVSRLSDGTLNYHNAGKIQASSDPADMRLQRMLGHLTTLVPKTSKNFLVIGFGAGATAGAVSIEPKLERETIIEIEPLVPEFVSKYFSDHNFKVAENPKVDVRIDDGRHFLMTTDQKFDGITSDPLDPWVKGAGALYTKEFFEAAKAHLTPGGVVTQFVQLYESTEEAVKSEIATFFEVFPHGSLFVNNVNGGGYDLVMLGQAEPTVIDVDELTQRLESPEYAAVAQSLREIGFYSASNMLATFAGRAEDLKGWTQNAVINRDRGLKLQYLAGLGLNLYRANDIYQNMVAYGPRMPPGMFVGSPTSVDLLARLIESGQFR